MQGLTELKNLPVDLFYPKRRDKKRNGSKRNIDGRKPGYFRDYPCSIILRSDLHLQPRAASTVLYFLCTLHFFVH